MQACSVTLNKPFHLSVSGLQPLSYRKLPLTRREMVKILEVLDQEKNSCPGFLLPLATGNTLMVTSNT